MKFSDGFWFLPENMTIMNGMHVWDFKVSEQEIMLYIAPYEIANRGAQLNTAIINLSITAPTPGVLGLRYEHFKNKKDPNVAFNLTLNPQNLSLTQSENHLTVTHGTIRMEIVRFPFTFKIWDHDQLLTQSSHKDMAYVLEESMIDHQKRPYFYQRLGIGVGELIYGLGERFSNFTKNGQSIEIWNLDGGTTTMQGYKNIPFYITNKGYGIFVNHPEKVSFEVASEHVSKTQFSVAGENLEYFIITGPQPKEVIQRYAQMTGLPALPPPWSFGLWLTTSFTTNYDEDTVNHFVDGMAERNIPLHIFHFDCFWMKGTQWCDFEWDPDVFPDPEGMLQRLKAKGLKICVWINPYIAQRSPLFDEGSAKGYFIKNPDGSVWQWDKWQAGQAVVDFTNPFACQWYGDHLRRLVDQGVDCFKTDFGEMIPTAVCYYNNADPLKMHNYYTQLYNSVVFNVLKEKKGEHEAVLFARSATVGGQTMPVHWGGDCDATYEAMAETLRGGLSLGLAAFGFWSHDIGGFESTAPAHLYKRWCAFGLLSSHSRLHGSKSYRVPWLYDDEAVLVLKYFTELKCQLMPYLYQQAVIAHHTGIPVIRALFLEFLHDRNVHSLDCQYMLGNALLIAPVFNEEGITSVYLPTISPNDIGLWTSLLNNERKLGGQWHHEQHHFMSLPLYVRPNQIIALGNRSDCTDYDFSDGIQLHLFELAEDHSATTAVPSRDGQTVALSVSAHHSNKQITFIAKGALSNWSICLRNITHIAGVTGGTQSNSKLGILIKATEGKGTVVINLN